MNSELIPAERIEGTILQLRGQKVMLNSEQEIRKKTS